MRTMTTMHHVGALAALLLAGTATGAHAQFSGDPGASGAGVRPPSPGRRTGCGTCNAGSGP